ncbi:hypothetical protein BOX15_Mlig002250g2 [Macrostomum lignano]|uniref:ANK_REP_REGION domain-containing protein n=2 Tax=Macrostomum lignano TaxID=282301 RepID=A0A1I8J3B8_9PLAT|nr:hypothetical protein BOX15_Mlig002250g2 [Macrostomum lignano]
MSSRPPPLQDFERMLREHLEELMEGVQKKRKDASSTSSSEDPTPPAVKSFLKAAASGDRRRCLSFMDGGGDPSARGKKSLTALHLAAHEGHTDVIRELLRRGAEIDATDEDGDTPLISAVINKKQEPVELLIEKGANVAHINNKGHTAADIGLMKRSLVIVTTLENVRRCLQFDSVVHEKTLMTAAQEGNVRIIDFWLKNHPDRKACNHKLAQSRTMAFIAALNGHLDIMLLLNKYKADFELTDDRGHTPLFCAAQNDHFEVVNFLLEKRCNINHTSITGRTPIFSAVNNGHDDIVRLLIRSNANVNQADEEGTTPLECAIKQGSLPIFHMLIDAGARIDHIEFNGYDFAMIAASNQQVDMLKELRAMGLSMKQVNKKNGETALLGACQVGPEESVGFLISEGSDLNHQNKRGVSPALRAAYNGHFVILMALGESGAKLDLPNKINETAILCAAQKSSVDMVQYLHGKGCNISVKDDNGKTLAWYAAKEDNIELLEFLAKVGAPLDTPDTDGNTPLMRAVKADASPETVRFLMSRGCSVGKPNQKGENAVDIAKKRNHEELLKVLQKSGSREKPSPSRRPGGANQRQESTEDHLDATFTDWDYIYDERRKKKLIGEGNFGRVYEARTNKGQTIAVKVTKLKGAKNDRVVQKAIDLEMKAVEVLKAIRHQNIAIFLKSEQKDGAVYVFTELIDGMSLADHLKDRQSFEESEIRSYASQICSTLDFLHTRKPAILHRDIKCSNIMLTKRDVIKLIDFGLAKEIVTSTIAAVTESQCGTWYYLAPELFSSQAHVSYTPKTDIWAFGCTIFEMAEGEPPNRDKREQQIPNVLKEMQEMPLPSKKYSSDMREFYRHCVAKNPEQRFTSTELLKHRFLRNAERPKAAAGAGAGAGARAASEPAAHYLDPNFTKWDIICDDDNKKRPIGEGGFGKVYKAYTDKHQFVAVKIVTMKGNDPKRYKRAIEQERKGIEILKTVRHPNIVVFLKSELDDSGQFCIFTELIAGISLFDLMKRQRKPFEESGIKKFSQQICAALNFLHRRRPAILHRDIKCSNVMLTHEGIVKLIDFGLAKEITTSKIAYISMNQCGTPYFMAPELHSAEGNAQYTPQSDVWAFGCTVFEMAEGKPPNSHLLPMQIPRYFHKYEMPDISAKVSNELRNFYRCCVVKEPEARMDTTDLLEHAFLA